ncbi:MAG: TonB-dependent receptor [Silvibacterium sp.]|nr:TonB-dependent receptor [Silvibacterium sp.]
MFTQERRSLWAALVIFVASALSAAGQSSITSVRGTVTDPSGAVLPGAKIDLKNVANGQASSQVANEAGEYRFSQVTPGTYLISVSSSGFSTETKKAELLVNQPATVNFILTVQASTETVDVSAQTATLNDSDATIGNALNNATIAALPSEGRNVPDLLSIQPGVLYLGQGADKQSDSRTGSVAGARSDQTNVTLDGLDDNDQTQGYAFTGVLRSTLDSVEEFRVTMTNANADEGRSSGGQVSMVTKSGTNQFHGSVYEYNRNTFTVANDWFNKQAQESQGLPNVPGKLIRNTFGGSLGGPIKKNKLFFFGNYEGQRTAENKQVTRTVPTASFQQGLIKYLNNGSVVTLNQAQIASMDPNCGASGTCPWGAGVDPYMLTVLNQYPAANGSALGDGINLGSYTFSSPFPGSLNTSIAKFDYTPNDKHHLFIRGNLQKDTQDNVVQFPGQAPSYTYEDNSKGLAAGDTWSISQALVNDFRYGYVRQGYSNRGIGQGNYTILRFMDQPTPESRSSLINVPVDNFIDNFTMTKGKHTFAAGGNWRIIHNNRNSDALSYSQGNTNEYWLVNAGAIAGQSVTGNPQSLDPGGFGFPSVDRGFANSYNIAVGMITGLVPQITGYYNYQVSKDGTTGTLLPQGTFLDRHFKSNELEFYVQDAWRPLPKLTLTAGLRYTLLQTPYETSGQQLAPTVDVHDWFATRAARAAQGVTDQPDLYFAPNGQARGLKPYWPAQHTNFAPRFAFAFAADSKTSIRGGFGIYYDHFGQGVVNSFDQLGSFGLTTTVSNPASTYAVDNSPRFTGIHDLPPNACAQPQKITYPYLAPNTLACGLAITWGIDDRLKTPYSEVVDFSVQRQLPGGFLLEADYVGRFGRRLLQQLDLAEPLDLADPQSGMDYFTAGTILSRLVDINQGNPNARVRAISYFEDLFPDAAGNGNSATQNIYSQNWVVNRGNETNALYNMDIYCFPGCGGKLNRYFQDQFTSLYTWSSIGVSSYNAGQLILRHAMSHGLQLDFSYTFSQAMDYGSDSERTNELYGQIGVFQHGSSFSEIINSYKPQLNRAVSDFDTRHLITADWVYQLPFGTGQRFAGGASRGLNALIGGWQFSGLNRWSSGLPFGVIDPTWSTNWQVQSYVVQTGVVKLQKHLINGAPNAFADPAAINNGLASGSPVRLPYPGEAGERNNYRGDGFFDIDTGLTKSWNITERQSLKFAWEIFNVTNSVRFDTTVAASNAAALNNTATSNTLGAYSSTLTLPRVQQFSLRYSF